METISRSWSGAGLVLVGLLFFVWPIPHSTTLRDILLVALVFLGLCVVRRAHRTIGFPNELRLAATFLILLSLWMVAVALFISAETAWSLAEIKGQWLRALVALAAGSLAAIALRGLRVDAQRIVGVVGLTLLIHVVVVDFSSLWTFFTQTLPDPHIGNKTLPTRITGLTSGSDKSNYLSNMMLYLLLAEGFIRMAYRRTFLPIGNPILVLLLVTTVFSIFVEAMRNGVVEIVLVLAIITTIFFYVARGRIDQRLSAIGLSLLLVLLVALGYFNFRAIPGWVTLAETIPIALDTDNHRAWLSWENHKNTLPRLKNGSEVDWSNYMRIARFKAGAEMVWERPLGVGFGRNAFAHAVKYKYHEYQSSHSHSGLVDLAIGIGIPGVLLWIGFLFSLWWWTLRHTLRQQSYASLLLLLIVSGFGIRMVMDSIIRDHMLQQFFFLAGLLIALSVKDEVAVRARNKSGDAQELPTA